MVDEELERIESILDKGIDYIKKGRVKEVSRLVRSLRSSWAVVEATRAEALLEGFALLAKRKPTRGKKRVLESMGYLWGNLDGLFLVRQPHDQVTDMSAWYDIVIEGGCAAFGYFTYFTEEHRCRFLVLADDEFEAVRYIEEIANFQCSDEKKILQSKRMPLSSEDERDRKGVYHCSPFTVDGMPLAHWEYEEEEQDPIEAAVARYEGGIM